MLEKISTKELVEELKEREGVKTEYAEPHQDKKLWPLWNVPSKSTDYSTSGKRRLCEAKYTTAGHDR